MSDTTYKFGVRLFLAGKTKPVVEFIPIFHGWIQRKALAGHQLIDVHDYSHVTGGPGILLVAHEANLNFDGQSLTYIRKQPATLAEILAHARQAVKLLELPVGASFEVFVNDRLATVTASDVAAVVVGKVTVKAGDPRERQTFVVV
jgi:hypothetical protein